MSFSENEKNVLCTIVAPSDKLPYPIKSVRNMDGTHTRMYDIPADKLLEVLQRVSCISSTKFAEGDVYYDIHSQKKVDVKDIKVIRYRKRNLIVSPDYTRTGGMEVDLLTLEQLKSLSGTGSIYEKFKD